MIVVEALNLWTLYNRANELQEQMLASLILY